MNLTLRRIYLDNVTLGILFDENNFPWLKTLELPNKNNQQRKSCIPEGTYTCKPYKSPTKGSVYLLENVPNRSMIEIHIANTVKDILGCIAVGIDFGKLDGLPAVIGSTKAMAQLHNKIGNKSFTLTITK
jgi:hypothetical protein